jgi:hypothetical protein
MDPATGDAGYDVDALYTVVRSALALERGSAGPVPPSGLTGVHLRRAIMANRLVPLLSPWAGALGLSDDDAAWLGDAQRHNTVRSLQAARQAEAMQGRLAEMGVDSLILKGVPLSVRTTGTLAGRQYADIDILVALDALGRAERVLQESGVRHGGAVHDSPLRGPYHRWVRWTQNQQQHRPPGGHPVELHWRLFANARLLPLDFDTLWPARSEVADGTVAFTTLGPAHELLFVAVHAAVHGFSRLHWLVDVVRLLRTTSEDTWAEVTGEAARTGATRGLALATRWADHLEPNRRRIAMPSRTRRRVTSLARRVMPADQSMIRSMESLGVKVHLNSDVRYVANQVARWAVPPGQLDSVGARPPLAFVYLPLRQVRILTDRFRAR